MTNRQAPFRPYPQSCCLKIASVLADMKEAAEAERAQLEERIDGLQYLIDCMTKYGRAGND